MARATNLWLSSSCLLLDENSAPGTPHSRLSSHITLGPNMSASRLLYGITVFLGAFLLFLVEPIAAKQLLPILGGSSAVWLTCLVFFQVTLLLGYLYAHWITRCRASGWRQHVYLVTLAAAVVLLAAQRISPATLSPSSDHPVTTIF